MTHLAEADLVRWHREHREEDRARVIAHLAACDACRQALAAIVRADNADADAPPRLDPADFVGAGYRAQTKTAAVVPIRRFGSRNVLLGLAAAAAIILGVAIPWSMREGTAPQDATPRPRGADVQALSPAGIATGDVIFDWASGVSAARYRVDVGSGDRTLVSAETDRAPLPMPAGWRTTLQPGTSYWWSVTALDRQGGAIVSSPRQPFSLGPRQ